MPDEERYIPERMCCPICSEQRCAHLSFGKITERRTIKIECHMCGCQYVVSAAGVVEIQN